MSMHRHAGEDIGKAGSILESHRWNDAKRQDLSQDAISMHCLLIQAGPASATGFRIRIF